MAENETAEVAFVDTLDEAAREAALAGFSRPAPRLPSAEELLSPWVPSSDLEPE